MRLISIFDFDDYVGIGEEAERKCFIPKDIPFYHKIVREIESKLISKVLEDNWDSYKDSFGKGHMEDHALYSGLHEKIRKSIKVRPQNCSIIKYFKQCQST